MEKKLSSSLSAIDNRIDPLEDSLKTISASSDSTSLELSQVHALFAEFGIDIRTSTKSFQTKVEKELADLSAKMTNMEKHLREQDSSSKDYKSDGPSFATVSASMIQIDFEKVFLVVFLAGVSSAAIWHYSIFQNIL